MPPCAANAISRAFTCSIRRPANTIGRSSRRRSISSPAMAVCRASSFAVETRASKAGRRTMPSRALIGDPACVMVNRNQGSGTRVLIDRLLGGARPRGYAVQPRNHNAVAAAVVQGRADWGMTLDTIARNAGLGFLPVQAEQYDFIVPRSRADRPGVVAFRTLLQQASTREALATAWE